MIEYTLFGLLTAMEKMIVKQDYYNLDSKMNGCKIDVLFIYHYFAGPIAWCQIDSRVNEVLYQMVIWLIKWTMPLTGKQLHCHEI